MEQGYFNYNFEPNLSIENFFVGSANRESFNILTNNNSNNNKFFLIGPKKSGKTHLAFIWKKINNAIIYDNNLDLIINSNNNVLIDNIFKDIDEENIFYIINHCFLNNLKILITSNLLPNTFKIKLLDLSSRLKTFNLIYINLPDDELLTNLMIKLFHDKQIIVKNHEIFNYIIKRIDRSYNDIFSLVNRIDKLLFKTNKQLTIPLIKELI